MKDATKGTSTGSQSLASAAQGTCSNIFADVKFGFDISRWKAAWQEREPSVTCRSSIGRGLAIRATLSWQMDL